MKPRVVLLPPATYAGKWWAHQDDYYEIGVGITIGDAIRDLSRRIKRNLWKKP